MMNFSFQNHLKNTSQFSFTLLKIGAGVFPSLSTVVTALSLYITFISLSFSPLFFLLSQFRLSHQDLLGMME